MKAYRGTFLLVGLFFAGLLALWALDYAGVPTDAARRQRMSHILPELADLPETGVTRLEIASSGRTVRFERRGPDRWQLTQPIDVAADPANPETLIRNLRGLRRSPDSGTITGPPESYGLAEPRAVIRLWAASGTGDSAGQAQPVATLEVGKTVREQCYVRPAGSAGIEVIDRKLLATIDSDVAEYREQSLLPVPTFQVWSLRVRSAGLDLQVQRGAANQWRLVTPVAVPAEGPRIESLLAALSSIRVVDGARGFVADGVTDFSPYGLDRPRATIELTSRAQPESPLILHVGEPSRDHPDRVYVRRDDQDDVALVSDRFLTEVPRDSISLRSRHVTELDPAAVSRIEIASRIGTFKLERRADGWQLTSPQEAKADTYLVQSFLTQLDGLQTSEFLPPARVAQPDLDPPLMTLRVWQLARTAPAAGRGTDPPAREQSEPVLAIRLGRHDILKKTVFARLEGDDVILALPDSLAGSLPRNLLAFRDRGVLTLDPASVGKLTLVRDGVTTVLQPDESSGGPNAWRMRAPVQARADTRAITQLLALLASLRAEDFSADSAGDGRAYGLDRPSVVVAWETSPRPGAPSAGASAATSTGGRLSIGGAVPGKPASSYASLEGRPFVFTLSGAAVQSLTAELHDTQILSLPPDSIRRLAFHLSGRTLGFTPSRTLGFTRSPLPRGLPTDWTPDAGVNAGGIDLSRFNDLVKQLAQLRTTRFTQYEGPIADSTGLAQPRLSIEISTGEGTPPLFLRIGETRGQSVLAAAGTSNRGAVFLLPASAWNALIQSLTSGQEPELPAEVFAP